MNGGHCMPYEHCGMKSFNSPGSSPAEPWAKLTLLDAHGVAQTEFLQDLP